MQSLLFTFIAPPPERPGELVHRIIALLDVINFKLMCRIKSWYDQAHYRHKNVIIITIIIIIIIVVVVIIIIIIIIITYKNMQQKCTRWNSSPILQVPIKDILKTGRPAFA